MTDTFLQGHSLWRYSPSSRPSDSRKPASVRFSMWLQCCSLQRTRTLAAGLQDLRSSWGLCGLDLSLLHARYLAPFSPHPWSPKILLLIMCEFIPWCMHGCQFLAFARQSSRYQRICFSRSSDSFLQCVSNVQIHATTFDATSTETASVPKAWDGL